MKEHDDEITGKAYDTNLIRRLFGYLRPYRFKVSIAVMLLILHGFLELVAPWLLKIAIDQDIAQKDINGLTIIAGIILAVLIVQFFVEYTQYLLTQWIGQHIMFDMRTRIFAHIQKLPLSYFDRNPVGRLVTRTMNDVESLNNLLSNGVVTIIGDIFVLFGIVVAMLLLNWQLALVTFTVLPVIIVVTFLFRIKVRKSFRKIRVRLARINSYLRENIAGMAVVQVFNRESKNRKKFSELGRDHLNAHLQTISYFAVFFPTIEILRSIALALILWYGGLHVFSDVLTIGVMVAFIQYLQRFFHPIRDLAEKYNILQQAMASSERIFSLLDTPEQAVQPSSPGQLPPPRGEINFQNVWFAYNPDEFVLKDLNLDIQSGEKVAIVGSTGAGKTSLVHLIMRLYEPTRGRIQLDGTDIRHANLYDLRRRIGLVQQDVFIFSGSVAFNIGLGHSGITRERIVEAAQNVNAHGFISALDDGYDHILTERGSNLSVGQKQLLAFARVLAFNPEILILDEATSSVDTETELLIRDAINKVLANRTSLIIAHRLSTIRNVDRILVLHKGEIREMGTHRELLEKKGIYYRLYELQFNTR